MTTNAELSEHLSELEDVRTRRMAESWQASVPSSEQIVFAAQRLRRARVVPRRASRKVLLVALVQGFIFGVGSLAAASWALNRVYPPGGVSRSAVGEQRAPTPRTSNPASVGAARANPVEAPRAIPGAAFDNTRDPSGAPQAVGKPAGAWPGKERAHDAPPEAEPTPAEMNPGVAALPPLDLPGSGATDGPWAKVAHALAASDWLRADQALKDLSLSPDAQTRDAAELARAQLWIAHGRGADARVTVERLARTAPTPLIRRRAAALLEQLH